MKFKKRFLAILLASSLIVMTAACSSKPAESSSIPSDSSQSTNETTSESTTESTSEITSEGTSSEAVSVVKPTEDRAGNPIEIPDEVERIASLAGSFTEILVDLGFGDQIVAIDLYSIGLDGVDSEVPAIDMMSPDIETLLSLDLDLIFASNISDAGSEASIFQQLIDAGVTVAYIPSANSLEEIKLDIEFIGAAVGADEEMEALINNYDSALTELEAIGVSIPEEAVRSVMVEISALPYIYSTGSGTFLHELIELIGAENVLADEQAWVPVTEEAAIALNPDVILTNVNYIDEPVDEILHRAGWESVTAVANGDVYAIDNSASSLPNHNVVKAGWEIARAIYPEYYN